MLACVHIIKCYGENAKNFGLVNIFVLFGCLMVQLKLTENGLIHIITHNQDLDELCHETKLLRDEQ